MFEKVAGVYSKGVRAFYNLWQMAKGATEKALKQECKEYILPGFAGWRSKDKAFLTGVYFEDPDKLYFEFDEGRSRKRVKYKDSLNIEGVEPDVYPNGGSGRKAYYSWGKQLDNSFFHLGKEQQFEEIHRFFRECLDAINRASRVARK